MNDRNAVITGGTKGIGKAIAHTLAREGFALAVCARTRSDLEVLKEDLAGSGISLHTFVADLSEQKQVHAFANFVKAQCPVIDLLVNNAGLFVPGSILDEDPDSLDLMLRTNLMSAYHLTRALAPQMIARGSGHIFNMCSIASQIAYPNGGSYSISKFALLGFSKVLREELKDKGIKVTSILPGATWSNSWQGIDLPESRLMQAQDIADLVLTAFKLSPSAVVEDLVVRPQLGDL